MSTASRATMAMPDNPSITEAIEALTRPIIDAVRRNVDLGFVPLAEQHEVIRLDLERRQRSMAYLAGVKPNVRGFQVEAAMYQKALDVLEASPEGLASKANEHLAKGEFAEAGRLLKMLKERKPRGISWEHYLEDLCISVGRWRADNIINTVSALAEEMPSKDRKAITKPTIDKSRESKWGSTSCDEQGECDYDHEHERAFPDDPDWKYNCDATDWQQAEGLRLAREYALFRRGTRAGDFTGKREAKAREIAREWLRTAEKIRQHRRARKGT